MIALSATARRERIARRVLHDAWCRSGRLCRGDNAHAVRAYRDLGARVASTPDRAALLALLHDMRCPQQVDRARHPHGCTATREHTSTLAATPYVARLLHALHPAG